MCCNERDSSRRSGIRNRARRTREVYGEPYGALAVRTVCAARCKATHSTRSRQTLCTRDELPFASFRMRLSDALARLVGSRGHRMRLEPQRPRGDSRIDPGFTPPCGFIAAAVNLAMVAAAQRDGELIADLAAERAALREPQVMGIRQVVGRKSDKAAWQRI